MTRGVRHYPASALRLEKDETGSRYWSISLKNSMLSYFEVPPGARFAEHAHESEQITYVLDGVLIFRIDGREYRVAERSAIAIPANVPHEVRALDGPVRAVDAWSPPRDLGVAAPD